MIDVYIPFLVEKHSRVTASYLKRLAFGQLQALRNYGGKGMFAPSLYTRESSDSD